MRSVGLQQHEAARPLRGTGASDLATRFEALVVAGHARSEALRARLRSRLEEIDPVAVWLEAAAELSAFGQARSELLLCHFKFRARLLHDRLRLSRWIDWVG
jgi:hypothetical protein